MKNKSLNEVLSELAKNWKTLDEIEKEYIALRLLNDSSADFMYLMNVICAAVEFVDDMATMHCTFDNGRRLGLIYGEDSFRKLTEQELEEENSAICVEETTDDMVEESGMTQSM